MSRAAIHEDRTRGERIADGVAAGIGSWRFIIMQTAIVIVWMVLNTVAWMSHWDPYPWILLNLLFSTQAAYTGPILLLASNRQAAKDRQRDDRDDEEIGDIHRMQREQMISHATQINQNTTILAELREMRALITAPIDQSQGGSTSAGSADAPTDALAASPGNRKQKGTAQ